MIDLMRETSLYNMQLQAYLMDFNPSYDNITPFGDATPNRMGSVISAEWQSAKIPVKLKVEQTMMTEVRGHLISVHVWMNIQMCSILTKWM